MPSYVVAMTKLLIVEDHALVREGLVRTLRQIEESVEVCEAADFDGASALLDQQGGFDLMLLDLGLPGLDGLCCLRTFRQHYPLMPVVILSAYDDAPTVRKAMRCGASAFVSKACSSDRLLEVVREVLAGRVFKPDLSLTNTTVSSPHLPVRGRGGALSFRA